MLFYGLKPKIIGVNNNVSNRKDRYKDKPSYENSKSQKWRCTVGISKIVRKYKLEEKKWKN